MNTSKPAAKPNAKKVTLVTDLASKLAENQNIAIVSYDKTTHMSLETLRRSLKKVDASILVVKTSLLEKAIEQTESLKTFKEKAFPVKNNVALLNLKGDWSAGLKAFHEFMKKDTSVGFLTGFLDGTVYNTGELKKLATLPSKVELLGKVVGSLKSPVNRVDYSIKFPMTYFVNTLKARAAKG